MTGTLLYWVATLPLLHAEIPHGLVCFEVSSCFGQEVLVNGKF